eukprot:500751-Pleurochrysis_carterae.AAC.1
MLSVLSRYADATEHGKSNGVDGGDVSGQAGDPVVEGTVSSDFEIGKRVMLDGPRADGGAPEG